MFQREEVSIKVIVPILKFNQMKKLIPAYVRVPVLFAIVFAALEYFIDSGDQPAFVRFPMVSLFLGVFLFLLIAIEWIILKKSL